MKTAGRENPNHGVKVSRTRAHGAAGQNRSCSIKWAAKQEKLRPQEGCFFLTSPFIELLGTQIGTNGRMTHHFPDVRPEVSQKEFPTKGVTRDVSGVTSARTERCCDLKHTSHFPVDTPTTPA